MYRLINNQTRKNIISFELIYEPSVNLHMHWPDPLLLKHKAQNNLVL